MRGNTGSRKYVEPIVSRNTINKQLAEARRRGFLKSGELGGTPKRNREAQP